ncbi:hypothetical protein MS3_00000962 [Schistosoma haematobium]|uniref:Secreted protein n=1 Tax=Schistosoma haematobium TaxID=6185 RepID=A0A922LZC0_SCHHA|nr:hypothetical protein MS3_00000962 [Schistosoma haematobium]KAH9596832.1 hypothetical protein MS3_00000962 [Schistosoma haematobium]
MIKSLLWYLFISVNLVGELAINRTIYTAQLAIIEKTRSVFHQKPKQHVSDCVTSHCVYQFTCICGNTYIGRRNRDLQLRVGEHIPKRLQKQMDSNGQIR